MSDEISLAFGHPGARAEATAPDGPLDSVPFFDNSGDQSVFRRLA